MNETLEVFRTAGEVFVGKKKKFPPKKKVNQKRQSPPGGGGGGGVKPSGLSHSP